MKKTKKMAALLLALVMLASILTACGKSSDTKTEEPTESTDTVIDPTVPEEDAPDEVEAPAEEVPVEEAPTEEATVEEENPADELYAEVGYRLESPRVLFDQEGVQVVLESLVEHEGRCTANVKISNHNEDNKQFNVDVYIWPNYSILSCSEYLYAGDEVEEELDAELGTFLVDSLQVVRTMCTITGSSSFSVDFAQYTEWTTESYDEAEYYGELIGEFDAAEYYRNCSEAMTATLYVNGFTESKLQALEGCKFKVYMKEWDNYYVTIVSPSFASSGRSGLVWDQYNVGVTIKDQYVENAVGFSVWDTVVLINKDASSEDYVRKMLEIPNGEPLAYRLLVGYRENRDLVNGSEFILQMDIDPHNKAFTLVYE